MDDHILELWGTSLIGMLLYMAMDCVSNSIAIHIQEVLASPICVLHMMMDQDRSKSIFKKP